MTPSQMLRKLPKEAPRPTYVPPPEWAPVERTTPLLLPAEGLTAARLLQLEHDESLRRLKCPVCGSNVDHEMKADGLIYFTCQTNGVFHDFRRPATFLTRD